MTDTLTERELVTPVLPPSTRFGVATASYQIEGAVTADGRGPSIWDTYSHTPGATVDGDTGDVACDHYHRHGEDVAIMRDLGVDAYRFSIAWPRVQPLGSGAVNPAGLAFYERLVDELLDAGIEPVPTLYHWDLPQPLEDAGGWPLRDTAERFADYATIVHDALGDRVSKWITLNEPYCSSILGYAVGRHAPGRREGRPALAAAHHLLLGHGLAVQRMRERRPEQEYGITLNFLPVTPASASPADVAATARVHLVNNTLFTEPVLAGTYPAEVADVFGAFGDLDFVKPGDLEITSAPVEFLGVNYYFPGVVAAAEHDVADPASRTAADLGSRLVVDPDADTTTMGWPVEADGLTRLLRWIHDTYGDAVPAIEITENGRACADVVVDGEVDDPDRVRYLADHLAATADAIAAGVPVRAYYCWSLLDNFEWAEGYAQRFGIVYVDYATQQRIPKTSAHWYGDLARAHRARR
ncbi:GH1 family beta-glucosidase [Jatrophihabitans sp. YIM 134969]